MMVVRWEEADSWPPGDVVCLFLLALRATDVWVHVARSSREWINVASAISLESGFAGKNTSLVLSDGWCGATVVMFSV